MLLIAAAWSAMFVAPLDVAEARHIKVARVGDALTLDPHAYNEGPTHALNHQIYETLVLRDATGKMVPSLAESWSVTADPTVWEFKLRRGVKFHDGSAFTADDVIFSLQRARQPTSGMSGLLASIDELIRVDESTVRIKTKGPNPLLPSNLGELFIMSKAWAQRNKTETVQNVAGGQENFAARHANGTGPFVLVRRDPNVQTVLRRNEDYWGRGQLPLEITGLTFLPIRYDAARVTALTSGLVDFVQDVPVQEIDRLRAQPNLVVRFGPENRAIFLGLNVGGAELASSNVRGRNPFADKRVRQAISMAINRSQIQKTVMRGQSIPTGIIAPPGVNGYTADLDKIPPLDLDKAKALLAEAGYGAGFQITMNCPNDRYVNDEAICQSVAAQLAPIGIAVTLVAQSKVEYLPLLLKDPPQTDFYLLGWGVQTFDSEYIFSYLYHTRGPSGGAWNATRYSNPDLDRLIEGLSSDINLDKRSEVIARIWAKLQDETIYVPLHIQTLAYAMKGDIDVPVDISNQPKFKLARVKKQ